MRHAKHILAPAGVISKCFHHRQSPGAPVAGWAMPYSWQIQLSQDKPKRIILPCGTLSPSGAWLPRHFVQGKNDVAQELVRQAVGGRFGAAV